MRLSLCVTLDHCQDFVKIRPVFAQSQRRIVVCVRLLTRPERGARRTEQPETPPPTYSSLRASSRHPSYPDNVEETVMMMPHIDKMQGGGDRPVARSIDMGHVDSSKLAAIHRPDYAAQRAELAAEEGPTTRLV